MEVNWMRGYNPKSPHHVQGVATVRGAYSDFWKNIKFRKGWDAPLFSEEEVDILLEQAAAIVTTIRAYLDALDHTFKMRVQGGSSFEYLWEVDYNPLDEPKRFVKELVHATLRDAKGYVEGLRADIINAFVDEFLEREDNNEPAWNPSQLQEVFTHLQTQLQSMSFDKEGEGEHHEAQLRHLKKATQHLILANRHLISSTVKEVEEEDEKEKNKLSVSQTDFDLDLEIDEELEQKEKDRKKEEKTEQENEDEGMGVEEEERGKEEGGDKMEDVKEMEEEKEKEKDEGDQMRVSATGIKVNKVQEDVDFLQPKIKDLVSDCDTLEKEIEQSDHPSDKKQQTKALTKKCLEFSERLMQSLLKLDEIQGGSEECRAKRKEQARTINSLMDKMDDLKDKIRGLQALVENDEEKQEREQKEKEEIERQQQEKEQLEKKEEERRAKVEREREEKELRESWAELKLDAKLRVTTAADRYIITGNIPGMDEKDIGIEVVDGGNTLQISGVRLPTPAELQQMKNRLAHYTYPKEHEKELLLRLGAGRFGRFCDKYSLKNCDRNNIEASYERGVLRVFIPRLIPQRKPHNPYQQRRQHNAFPGFYSDRDAW
eukprot:CAMPEP_0201518852 /NCGR_PEP_ID=MMETSP0161_2-20130828/9580_1 /ASSEMBLY_ACC=CAM_ASM_000251 /TAXON_ID=180227 /ORGANISM="Neoparamoeba aestuarina, Strain SoJaBio B1-5/56/2" /LENGTH=600 /DNA_ID=CAMNT_0047916741 /DNA_START=99 /DNA_END=1898 /DNA_ORIENTATION=+